MVFQDISEKGQSNGYAPLDTIGQVPLVHLPNILVTTTGALATHEAAADPHPGYQRESQKGVANGYPSLDASGLVPVTQLPAEFWGWESGFVGVVPAVQAALYTVPASKTAGVHYLLVRNTSSSTKSVDIHIRESGAMSSTSLGSVTLGEMEYAIYTDTGPLPLSEGDAIEGVASDGVSVAIIILVQENGGGSTPLGGGGGGLAETFETVSNNLSAYDYAITRTGGEISSITYDLGGGLSIVKTINKTGGLVSSIVLSGDTPGGITLTKTLTRNISDEVISVEYT